MEWIVTILLAVIVGYILAESECFGIGEFFRCIFDCVDNIIGFISYIFNRSTPESISGNEERQDNDKFNLIGISASAVEDFKKIGNHYYEGYVKANGTYWKAVCKTCRIANGDIVIVKDCKNLTLEIEPMR
jgi:membrane protein implicated in regulation of membrane protease activity